MTLHRRILAGLVVGGAIGLLARQAAIEPLRAAVLALEPIGTVFIRLVSMVVVPLVVASVFTSVASLGDARRLGRIGGKTLLFFAGTTLVAAVIGLFAAVLTGVGASLAPEVRQTLVGANGGTAIAATTKVPGLVQTLIDMTPQNPFASAAQGDLFPLIVAVCFFAAAATATRSDGARAVTTFFEGVNNLAMIVIRWLMQLAPIAVLVLIAATVVKSGTELLAQLLVYAAVVVGAMLVHLTLVLAPLLRVAAGLGPLAFLRAVSDPIVLAFSTASSSVTLPVSIAAARSRLNIPDHIASFVLPSGVTLNKNGAAIYKALTAVFLAHVYGLDLGVAQDVMIVAMSALAASTGAGVPGSSLVTTLMVLNAIGLGAHAAEGIALVVVVDRPLDMCRTALNTFANLVVAACVARSEGTPPSVAVAPTS